MKPELNKIYQGSALDVMKTWPDGFIDCLITSPPYWGLRDYGVSGQLGLESTFQEYIAKLIQIFDEVKRVLKPTGTIWVNLGDSYAGSGSPGGDFRDGKGGDEYLRPYNRNGLPSKSLCCIPDRFKIAMVDKGWILRNTIIWKKPNCMPSSASDRFTVDFEYVYFYCKSTETQFWTNSKTSKLVSQQPPGTQGIENIDWEWIEHSACEGKGCDNKRCVNGKIKSSLWEGHDYWFEQQFEAQKTGEWDSYPPIGGVKKAGGDNPTYSGNTPPSNPQGRNMRCVWDITTKGYKEAHFATFPEKLIEPMIKAGCPKEICVKCGKGRGKIYQDTGNLIGMGGYGSKTAVHQGVSPTSSLLTKKVKEKVDVGYTDCGCNAGFKPGIVADIFMGSGTTAVVAKKLGRQWVGIELNEKYIEMANRRLENTVVNGVLDL